MLTRGSYVAPAPGTVIQWEAEMLKQPFGEVLRLECGKGMVGQLSVRAVQPYPFQPKHFISGDAVKCSYL